MGDAIQESVKSNSSIILQNYKDIKDDPTDGAVFIDFSSPDVTEEILDYCNEKLLPLVIGTTGLSKDQQDMLLDLSKDIPILMASNMSMGIAKLKKSISTFIQESNDIFECEITEIHHTKKIDSPSGTALELCNYLEEFSELKIKKPIAIRSFRFGSVFGIHRIKLTGKEGDVYFQHIASSREIFASGAIQAAEWTLTQSEGLFSFDDFLNKRL